MLDKIMQKSKNLFLFAKKIFSTKKEFKEFLLAYFILQFELIRKALIKLAQVRLGKSPELYKIYQDQKLQPQFDVLKKEGCLVLPKTISDSVIESIKKQVEDLPCSDPYNKQVGSFKLNEAPMSVNIAGYRPTDLIKIPEIMMIANDPYILAIVQEYFGCVPTITGIEMWWSLTGRAAPQYAQLFHRDFAGIKFLKLFVYLTDVFPDDGPHVYVTGSANLKKMRRPTRFKDDYINQSFPNTQVRQMCGQKGMIFLEDTFGLHKGTLPIVHNRLIMQAIYGIHPLVYEDYSPAKLNYGYYDPYINRLFLEPN